MSHGISFTESMGNELCLSELGERALRNHQAADLAALSGRSPDGVWATATMMFAQVANGLRPYRKRVPRRWTPSPKVLLEQWP